MELYSRELFDALSRIKNVEAELVALPGRSDGSPPSLPRLFWFMVRAVAQLTWKGWRYDVIHAGDMVLFPLLVWSRLVAPQARRGLTVHGLDLIFGRHKGLKPAIYRFYLRLARVLLGDTRIVANSRATAEVARAEGFRHIRPIALGVRLPAEPPTIEPHDERYILFVGRLVPRKGAAWFATTVLPKLPADVEFRVVGTPWDAAETAAVQTAGRTRYLGRVGDDELRALRRGARAVVMPNRTVGVHDMEGFGLAAIEAAAEGAVVLASAIEGIRDALRDGETGFLLPEGDADAWARRLNEVLSWTPEQRQCFSHTAQKVLASDFSWERTTSETLEHLTGSTRSDWELA